MDIKQIIVSLIGTICVMSVVAFMIEGSHHMAKVRGDGSRLKRTIFLGIVCGAFGIYATISGSALSNGAVVSVRDVGPMLAGLLGGPIAGSIAGFIAGLYRLLSGLPDVLAGTAIPCSVSTLLIGIGCGFLEKSYKKVKKFRALWSFLVGAVMEVFHLLLVFFYYMARTGAQSGWELVSSLAIPMILANAIGAFLITFTIDVVHAYQKSESHEKAISSELSIANSIQNDMLPVIFPDFPGRKELSLSAKMVPAKEVGGDFYDFFFIDGDHFAILIGDVSGKGVPAALFMVISKTILKNDAQSGLSPSDVLTKANRELCEGNKENMFVTVWLGIYEISTGKLTYANGGHNPPVIKTSDGDYKYLKNVSGFILAGTPKMKYKEFSLYLKPNDKILLYTDGVTEAMNSDQKSFGEQRLLDVLRSENKDITPSDSISDIEKAVVDYRGKAPQSDDITMLLLQINQQTQEMTVDAKKENFDKVSDFMTGIMKTNQVSESVINKMSVVLDELYSNVVSYSQSPFFNISVKAKDHLIDLVLKYKGNLFDMTKANEPDITLDSASRPIGGLGIMIVKKSVDTINYSVENSDTNVVKITKKY